MKSEFLHLFINEDIYFIDEPTTPAEGITAATATKGTTPGIQKSSVPRQEEDPEVSPQATVTAPFGFYATVTQPAEKELLHKIIAACKIPASDYKIFEHDLSITRSKKAVVFSDDMQPVQRYRELKIEQTDVVYAKSLATLMTSEEDKAELWGVLQSFTKECR